MTRRPPLPDGAPPSSSALWRGADLLAESVLARPAPVGAAALILVVLIAGVFWPNAADGLLRLLLTMLAIGYIGLRVFRSMPPLIDERYSPFAGEPLIEKPPAAPQPLRKLVTLLEAEAERATPGAGNIPGAVRLIAREEAARRLADGHRLKLEDPTDHPRIRRLVGDPTWLLIRPPVTRRAPLGGIPDSSRTLPLRQLDQILDDLEKL